MGVSRATARAGLYFSGNRLRFARRLPAKTAPCKQVAAPRGHYP